MMTTPIPSSDAVLRLCAAADPAPWFPSEYARTSGTDRDALDEPLNQLRLTGMIQIRGWEAGRGQCYILTDAGRAAAADPRARRTGIVNPLIVDEKNPAADVPRSP